MSVPASDSREGLILRTDFLPEALRPPSSTQKQYMGRDSFALSYLRHWLKLRLEETVARVGASTNDIETIKPHLSQMNMAEGLTPEDYLLTLETLDRFVIRLGCDEHSSEQVKEVDSKAREFISILQLRFLNLPLVLSNLLESNHYILSMVNGEEHKIHVNERSVIHLVYESASARTAESLFIIYLYILDHEAIVTNDRGRGIRIPRLLPFYPSRTITKRLLDTFKGHIATLRRVEQVMISQGREFESATREEIKEIHEQWVEAERKAEENKHRFGNLRKALANAQHEEEE